MDFPLSNRAPAMGGVLNFRDFGGYPAESGRVVRGALFRSAHFAEATDEDVAFLDSLGVETLIDLRRPEERAAQPNRWPSNETRLRVIANDEGPVEPPPHLVALTRADLNPQVARDYMLSAYRAFAFEARYLSLFRALFAALLENEGAVVVHCAAGKDRTGLACALVLHALGVSRHHVYEDYALTNRVVDLDSRLPALQERIERRLGRAVDAETLRPMLGVDASYLDAAFSVIEQEAGGLDAYLQSALGVGPAEVRRLRARLLA